MVLSIITKEMEMDKTLQQYADEMLGKQVRCSWSGFQGRCTAVVQYNDGRIDVCIHPGIDTDGNYRKAVYHCASLVELVPCADDIPTSNED